MLGHNCLEFARRHHSWFHGFASLALPKCDRDPRVHAYSNEPCCPGFFDLLLDVLLDFVLGKTWSRKAQEAPWQARTSDDRLASYCRGAQAQLQGDRKACLNPENAHLGSPTEVFWPSFIEGSNRASSGSLLFEFIKKGLCWMFANEFDPISTCTHPNFLLTSVCLQVPDPFSLPVESPFLSRRRSSSTPIESCQNSLSDKYSPGIAQKTSAGTPQHHAKSKRDMSAHCPGHHEQGLVPASWESGRCSVRWRYTTWVVKRTF